MHEGGEEWQYHSLLGNEEQESKLGVQCVYIIKILRNWCEHARVESSSLRL